MPPVARVEKMCEPAWWVVADNQLGLVAEVDQRSHLALSVVDHATPVGPRERDDDPDLHDVVRKTGDPLARSPRSRKIPEGSCFAAASLGSISPSLVLSS